MRSPESKIREAARKKRVYQENRIFVWELKLSPCVDCGKTYHPCQMQFDHVNPSNKRAHVSALMRCKRHVIEEEIAKCELVCSNCHSLRTWKKQNE